MSTQYLGRFLKLLLNTHLIMALLAVQFVSAATIGPEYRPKVETPKQVEKKIPDRLNLIPLSIVVPPLDPGFNDTDLDLEERGIWPELRRTESIRSAVKIRDAISNLNQFETVLVVPNAGVSSDFYLLAGIEESTGEIMKIDYSLIDATGHWWFDKKVTYRVRPGWHERFTDPGLDPFQPLYDEIANEVWKVLKGLAQDHQRTQDENRSRKRKKNYTQLSKIQRIALVREIRLAQYFNPSLYSDALVQKKRGGGFPYYDIDYLPDQTSPEWLRVKKIQARDNHYLEVTNAHYLNFMIEANPSYEEWQEESFPFAREIRLARRGEVLANVATGLLAVATVAVAADVEDASTRDTALSVGAVATSAALVKGQMQRQKKNSALAQVNEIANTYHDAFKPMRVKVGNKIITLEGTAVEQYNQWREILTDLHAQENADIDSVIVVH